MNKNKKVIRLIFSIGDAPGRSKFSLSSGAHSFSSKAVIFPISNCSSPSLTKFKMVIKSKCTSSHQLASSNSLHSYSQFLNTITLSSIIHIYRRRIKSQKTINLLIKQSKKKQKNKEKKITRREIQIVRETERR